LENQPPEHTKQHTRQHTHLDTRKQARSKPNKTMFGACVRQLPPPATNLANVMHVGCICQHSTQAAGRRGGSTGLRAEVHDVFALIVLLVSSSSSPLGHDSCSSDAVGLRPTGLNHSARGERAALSPGRATEKARRAPLPNPRLPWWQAPQGRTHGTAFRPTRLKPRTNHRPKQTAH
jgi:hypothetical protein